MVAGGHHQNVLVPLFLELCIAYVRATNQPKPKDAVMSIQSSKPASAPAPKPKDVAPLFIELCVECALDMR
jgi:hypothetical protein